MFLMSFKPQPEDVRADLVKLVQPGIPVLVVANKMDLNPYTQFHHYFGQFAKSIEQRTKSEEQFAKNKEQRTKSEEQLAKSKEQRTKSEEQFAKNKEQRAKSEEQLAKSKEQRAKSEGQFGKEQRTENSR